MSGRFEGISDEMWEFLEPVVRKTHKGGGRPCKQFRNIINSILWVLITGARWCDLPENETFAKKSISHLWLKRWTEDGTWQKIQMVVIEIATISNQIDWQKSYIDGSFSPWQRRRGRRY